jgi:tRNA-splicing ligase RtcB (3'-phosphate/5'-hydroxy nucleic acid ligase)
MTAPELIELGFQPQILKYVYPHLKRMSDQGLSSKQMAKTLKRIVDHPHNFIKDEHFAELAQAVLTEKPAVVFQEREESAPWRQWGGDLEPEAVEQMRRACRLPISVRGALMPDAHLGYGLPIGGVLATRGTVIPYAVGVDIACRMKLTVLDMPVGALKDRQDALTTALEEETSFGMGASFRQHREHPVMDEDWSSTPVTKLGKDKAHSQLGSSGGGNHFAEFGELHVSEPQLGLQPGRYLALLTHSGSRGVGSAVANHYSKLAMDLHPELPQDLRHLAWLDLDSEAGQEYWEAMNLMGRYAAANHDCIHREVARHLGVEVLADVENHHNFAWKEEHFGEEVVVHRKGATPAGKGVLGIIPGSMASPAFVVRGLGEEDSLRSASHGAGRVMSRSKALKTFSWEEVKKQLKQAGVTLLSSGLDEVPGVYKDIHEVMAAQNDLVEVLATFHPRLVKMAPPDGRGRRWQKKKS